MNTQALVDAISAQLQKARAETQMTLGELINQLALFPPETRVWNLTEPHSYRGYYCDLAFERGEGDQSAEELLSACVGAMGRAFEGYKGGTYVMGELTPVWIAEYGCCGERVIAISADGTIQTAPDEP